MSVMSRAEAQRMYDRLSRKRNRSHTEEFDMNVCAAFLNGTPIRTKRDYTEGDGDKVARKNRGWL